MVDPGTRRCRKPFTRSGTLTVYTTVNGAKAQKALDIIVTPPKLKVTAAPQYLAGTQTTTFTATLTPSGVSWNVSIWTWMPDSGTIGGGLAGLPLVGWHVHSFLPGDPTDPLPYAAGQSPPSTCPQLANMQPPPGKVYTSKPGPSNADFQLTGGKPHIVVDKANVWLIDPNGTVHQYPRNQPGMCDALRL